MPSINDFESISAKVVELANLVLGSQDKVDQRFIKIFEELSNIKISLARLDERTSSAKEGTDTSRETTWKWVSMISSFVAIAISVVLALTRR